MSIKQEKQKVYQHPHKIQKIDKKHCPILVAAYKSCRWRKKQIQLLKCKVDALFKFSATAWEGFPTQFDSICKLVWFSRRKYTIEKNIYYVGPLLLQVYTSTKLHQQSHTYSLVKSQEDNIIVLESRILSHNLKFHHGKHYVITTMM